MKLKDIWVSQDIQNYMKQSFNMIADSFINIEPMTGAESVALETIIKNYCHVIRDQELNTPDEIVDETTMMLQTVMTHNIVQLVLEFRSTMKAFEYKKLSQDKTATQANPIDNDNPEANLIFNELAIYNEFDSMVKAMSYLTQNSKFIKDIYNELKTMVLMIYGV